MAGVHRLKAAQQVSAVCLLAQIEHHQLCADLQQTVRVRSVLSLWSLLGRPQKQGACMEAVAYDVN